MSTTNLDLPSALAELEAAYSAANPASQAQQQAAARVLPGANTRTVLHYTPFPLVIARAEGAQLWDLDGHCYTDFLGEYSAGLYGHSHPLIREAIEHALADGIVLGGPNRHEAELARLIQARFPSCQRLRFCNSGTEANLMALAAARAHSGRDGILAFHGGYHGGLLYYAHGGSPLNVPYPTLLADYNDLPGSLALLAQHGADLAAVIVEPMLGSGGAIPGDTDFLRGLRIATASQGILLIFDEVMSSRLGPGGLQGELGISPDLSTFGKYLGGGLSFGAFGGDSAIMDRFNPYHPDAWPHAGTYNNNVLTMAAGCAGLSQVYTPQAARALNATGDALRTRLNGLFAHRRVAMRITGVGSILGVHFTDRPVHRPADSPPAPEQRALLHLFMLSRGYYFARRGFMSLSLALDTADHDGLVDAFEAFVLRYRTVLEQAR